MFSLAFKYVRNDSMLSNSILIAQCISHGEFFRYREICQSSKISRLLKNSWLNTTWKITVMRANVYLIENTTPLSKCIDGKLLNVDKYASMLFCVL